MVLNKNRGKKNPGKKNPRKDCGLAFAPLTPE
jgi:hypothetical protein